MARIPPIDVEVRLTARPADQTTSLRIGRLSAAFAFPGDLPAPKLLVSVHPETADEAERWLVALGGPQSARLSAGTDVIFFRGDGPATVMLYPPSQPPVDPQEHPWVTSVRDRQAALDEQPEAA